MMLKATAYYYDGRDCLGNGGIGGGLQRCQVSLQLSELSELSESLEPSESSVVRVVIRLS